MRFLQLKTYGLALYILLSGAAVANPVDSLAIVGQAKLKVLFWDVYHSTLYNQTGAYQDGAPPIALKLHYLRDIDAESLIESTHKEWKKLGLSKGQYDNWLVLLKDIFPNIEKGDNIVLYVNKTNQSEFFHNRDSIGVIEDTNFGASFLRIWLDPNASYPKVRNKLVGLNQ